MTKIVLIKDHKLADVIQDFLTEDYLVLVTSEIEKAIEIYEIK